MTAIPAVICAAVTVTACGAGWFVATVPGISLGAGLVGGSSSHPETVMTTPLRIQRADFSVNSRRVTTSSMPSPDGFPYGLLDSSIAEVRCSSKLSTGS